jgi:hypothetical protein
MRKTNVFSKVVFMTLALSLAGMGSATAADAKASPEMAKFQAELKEANALADKAKSVDGEWRDIRWKKSSAVKVKVGGKHKKMSILAAAETYAKEGNYAKALQLVEEAKFQAKQGYEQAMEQKGAGPHF